MSFHCSRKETYDELCHYFDQLIFPYNIDYITVCLAGGGNRYFTEHYMDIPKGFKCQNVGSEQLECAIKMGYQISSKTYYSAIEANNIDALDVLNNHYKYDDNYELLYFAIKRNHYNAVKWVLDHYDYDVNNIDNLYCSNLELLKLLSLRGCILDHTCYTEAIKQNNLECIEYLYTSNIKWKDKKIYITDIDGYNVTASSLNKKLVQAGNVSMLRWFINHGVKLDYESYKYASTIDMIQFFINNHIDPCPEIWISSIHNIDTLKWLFRKGYRINDDTFNICVRSGDREVKKWLIKNKYKLDLFKHVTDPIIKYLPISLIENIMTAIYDATKDNKYRILNKQIYNETVALFYNTYENMEVKNDSFLSYVNTTSNKFGFILFSMDTIKHNYTCSFLYYTRKNDFNHLMLQHLILENEYNQVKLTHLYDYDDIESKEQTHDKINTQCINNYDLLTWYSVYKNRMPYKMDKYAKKLVFNKLNSIKNIKSYLSIYCYYNYLILNCYVFGIPEERFMLGKSLNFPSLPRPIKSYESLLKYMIQALDQPCSDPLYEDYKLFMLKEIKKLEVKVIDYINKL